MASVSRHCRVELRSQLLRQTDLALGKRATTRVIYYKATKPTTRAIYYKATIEVLL